MISRPILAVLGDPRTSLGRVVASLAATGVLLAFEVGALLVRERETSARSE
jgi:hypothetical protein